MSAEPMTVESSVYSNDTVIPSSSFAQSSPLVGPLPLDAVHVLS